MDVWCCIKGGETEGTQARRGAARRGSPSLLDVCRITILRGDTAECPIHTLSCIREAARRPIQTLVNDL
jgi:hypothetical protein